MSGLSITSGKYKGHKMSFDYRAMNESERRNLQGSTLSPTSGYVKIDNGLVQNRRNIKGSSSFAGNQNLGGESSRDSSSGDHERPIASINPNDGSRS